MNNPSLYHTLATAVRIEADERSGDLFIVFKVIDNNFKQEVKNNWFSENVELEINGKDIIKAIDG